MPQNTRSRQKGTQPAPPLPRRQTRSHKAPENPTRDTSRGSEGFSAREPGHTSARFSLSQSSSENPEYEPKTPPTPTPTGPGCISTSSKRQVQDENSSTNASPDLGAQQSEEQPRITHFDFSKYRPSTPGSKSRPIKIEDSPNVSPSSPIATERVSIRRELLASPVLLPEEPTIRHKCHFGNTSQVGNGHADGSSFIVPPVDLVASTGVTSIITSPKAATAFLHCFLAAEKYWLRSRDHDLDPDTRFWKHIAKAFNASSQGCSVDTWRTARVVATTLCSEPYSLQVKQQLSGIHGELSNLASAIKNCRRMSQRRRWAQQAGFEKTRTLITEIATGEYAQKGVLERKPRTLEDRDKLIQALTTECEKSAHITAPQTDTMSIVPGVDDRDKRKRQYRQLQPLSAGPNDASSKGGKITPRGPRNDCYAPEPMRRNPNKRFYASGSNRLSGKRPHQRHPYPPTGKGRGNWRGDAPSGETKQDTQCLLQRLSKLERTIEGMKHPRYSN